MLTVVPSARSRLSVLPAGTVNELMFTVAHSTASSTSSRDEMVPVHARAAGRAMTAPANTSSAERRTNVGDILRLVRPCRGRGAFAALVADEARERSAVEQRRAGAYMLVLRINMRDMREGEGVVRRVMRCCKAQLSYVEHMPMRIRRWEARMQTRRREKDHHDAGLLQRGLVTMHRRPERGSHRPTGNLGSGQQHGRTTGCRENLSSLTPTPRLAAAKLSCITHCYHRFLHKQMQIRTHQWCSHPTIVLTSRIDHEEAVGLT